MEHTVSGVTMQPGHCSADTDVGNTEMNRCGCAPGKPKQVVFGPQALAGKQSSKSLRKDS